MSDNQQPQDTSNVTPEKVEVAPVVDTKQADQIADLQSQVAKLTSHNEELFTQRKSDQKKRQDAIEEKARAEGDFELLLKSEKTRTVDLKKQLDELVNKNTTQSIDREAQRLAAELSEGHSVNWLADIVGKRLRKVNGQVMATKEGDDSSVMSLSELKTEIQGGEQYKMLLKGSKANGSGAIGNVSGTGTSTEMKRADFDAMDVLARSKLMAAKKVKIID